MQDLQIIENRNQRVMLTSQLAECYETTDKRISENFNANKDRYIEGKHYFVLEGEEKREFLNRTEITDGSKNAKTLYLWTEKGALLHAKSLNTDKAWAVYDELVDTYFNVKQNKAAFDDLSPELQMFKTIFDNQVQIQLTQKQQAQAIEDTQAKLDNALDVFAKPMDANWREETNRKINQICFANNFNYQIFKNELYTELEISARCDLTTRQENFRKRMREQGSTVAECRKITKIDIIERDEKLKLIFDSILKRYQAKYLK